MIRRIAILGSGRMAHVHAEAWLRMPGRAQVVGIASSHPAPWMAEHALAHLGAPDAAIRRADVDVVDICLPTGLHPEVACRALAAGKHVVCEKPMALDLAGADALLAAAQHSSGVLMVAHVVRFFPAYQRARRIVASSELGRPLTMVASRLAAGDPTIRWLRDRAQSGGVALDLMIHDYDFANAIFGAASSVQAMRLSTESVSAAIRYAGGGAALIEGSTEMPSGYPFRTTLRIRCERGLIACDTAHDRHTLEVWRPDAAVETLTIESTDPYESELRHLLDALDAGRPVTEGTPRDSRNAVAVGVAVLEACATQRQTPVDWQG